MNSRPNKNVKLINLGLIEYQKAWDFQTALFNEVIQTKIDNRGRSAFEQRTTENFLLFCEHPHVFTLGKSGDEKNLLIGEEEMRKIGAAYHRINRGGDITYHGPGQIVVYPILDLENFFTDIHRYMRLLEESVIQTLSDVGVGAGRIKGLTGVWLDPENENCARKICALGVKTSRWVTLHGLALNVNTDLSYFDYIVPCGIHNKLVTSLQKEKGTPQKMETLRLILEQKLVDLFGMEITVGPISTLPK